MALFLSNATAAIPSPGVSASTKVVTAKILVVDHTARALTVDVRGTIYLYWWATYAKFGRGGTNVTANDLAPGQTVKLITEITGTENRELVAEVNIIASETASEAANRGGQPGPPPKKEKEPINVKGQGGLNANPNGRVELPTVFGPPPVTRPPVSPYR